LKTLGGRKAGGSTPPPSAFHTVFGAAGAASTETGRDTMTGTTFLLLLIFLWLIIKD